MIQALGSAFSYAYNRPIRQGFSCILPVRKPRHTEVVLVSRSGPGRRPGCLAPPSLLPHPACVLPQLSVTSREIIFPCSGHLRFQERPSLTCIGLAKFQTAQLYQNRNLIICLPFICSLFKTKCTHHVRAFSSCLQIMLFSLLCTKGNLLRSQKRKKEGKERKKKGRNYSEQKTQGT